LRVKGNQKDLHTVIKKSLQSLATRNPHSWSTQEGNGRHEYRGIWVKAAPLSIKPFWHGVKQIWMYRTVRKQDGKKTVEILYGITDFGKEEITPAELLQKIKKYWKIENPCHQVLDVTLLEDNNHLRHSQSRHNWALMRRLVLSILQSVPGRTIPDRRHYLNTNQDFMLKLLGIPLQKQG
jgi:predicted transposase YbfD/YdcC